MITGWAAVAGTVFLIVSGIAFLLKKKFDKDAERNKKFEEAKNELKDAVLKHDFNAILAAERKLRINRK